MNFKNSLVCWNLAGIADLYHTKVCPKLDYHNWLLLLQALGTSSCEFCTYFDHLVYHLTAGHFLDTQNRILTNEYQSLSTSFSWYGANASLRNINCLVRFSFWLSSFLTVISGLNIFLYFFWNFSDSFLEKFGINYIQILLRYNQLQ